MTSTPSINSCCKLVLRSASLVLVLIGLLLAFSTNRKDDHYDGRSGVVTNSKDAIDAAAAAAVPLRKLDGMTEEELEAENPLLSEAPMTEAPTTNTPGSGFDNTNEVFTRAVEAIGGETALLSLDVLQMDVTGRAYAPFEATTPNEINNASSFVRSIQMQGPANSMVIEETVTPLFEVLPFVFPPSDLLHIINGDHGFLYGRLVLQGNGTLPTAAVMALKRQQYLFNPHFLLQKVLLQQGGEEDGEEENGPSLLSPHPSLSWFYVQDDVFTAIAVSVDPDTGFIQTMTTLESNALIRDVEVQVHFDNWTLVATESGLVFPTLVRMNIQSGDESLLMWEEERTLVATPLDFDNYTIFDLPREEGVLDQIGYEFGQKSQHLQNQWFYSGFGEYPNNPIPLEPVTLLENVLYLLPNFQTTNSAVVGFGNNQAILVEVPASTIHGANLVDMVQQVLPGSTIGYVIQSHHHIDHAGAVREVMALSRSSPDGAELIVGHDIALFYLTDVFGAQSNFVPDTWSAMGLRAQNASVVEVSDSDTMVVVNETGLSVTANNYPFDHSTDMIITFIETPEALYIFVADLYNAGAGLTIALDGPPQFFEYLRIQGVISSEDCTSDVPIFFIPAHGSILSLEEALAELSATGIDVGCP